MNRIYKMILGGMIVAAAMTGITACMPGEKEYRKQALELLKEKYAEEFSVEQYMGREWVNDYYEVMAYPDENPELLFEAKVACDGSYIADEYISARVCRDTEEKILENLSGMKGYIQLKAWPTLKTVQTDMTAMDLGEFLTASPGNQFSVYLYYCPVEKNTEETYKVIQKAFTGLECMKGKLRLYIVEEEQLRQIQAYFSDNAKIYQEHEDILKECKCISIPFCDGKIDMMMEEFIEKAGGRV